MTVRKVKDRDGGLSADADPGMAVAPIPDEDRLHAAPVLAMLGLVGGALTPLRLLGTVKP